MRNFKSETQAQCLLAVHAAIQNSEGRCWAPKLESTNTAVAFHSNRLVGGTIKLALEPQHHELRES